MLKVGFYDYYLDEWHANNYPALLHAEAQKRGLELDVCCAYAETDKPGGLNSQEWCSKYGCRLCTGADDLVQSCDALIILAPSFPQYHERMAMLPLSSGKPVYMDKIFAPDVATGRRMFEFARSHGTPLFSSSALRFANELDDCRPSGRKDLQWVATSGPNSFEVYAIHQIEMIQTATGGCAKRVKAFGNSGGRTILFDYGDRMASMQQMNTLPFQLTVDDGRTCSYRSISSSFFNNLISRIIDFFLTGQAPVDPVDTLAVMSMLWASHSAMANPDTWIII